MNLLEKMEQLKAAGAEAIRECSDRKLLGEAKVRFLGKSGEITLLMKGLKDVAPSERPTMGKLLNDARVFLENAFTEAEARLHEKERRLRLKAESLDVTYSIRKEEGYGALHPLTIVKNDIVDIFTGMGFSIADGPEIETTYYNFTALNIPLDHPARDSADTFYFDPTTILRTQTSAVQVHVMEQQKPPIRIICPGKVYRPDDDATHSPMFQQIEGLVIDEHVTLSDLKGILDEFAKKFFSPETKTRFRPSYFPFTEPSVEVDLSCAMCGGKGCRLCKGTGWLELLGAGVVNPAVLEMSGIDPSRYSGFAFGMGVERATMVKYGIPDMRLLFDNDIRYLKQFR